MVRAHNVDAAFAPARCGRCPGGDLVREAEPVPEGEGLREPVGVPEREALLD